MSKLLEKKRGAQRPSDEKALTKKVKRFSFSIYINKLKEMIIKMNKIIAFLVIVLIIICGIGVAVYFKNPNSQNTPTNNVEATTNTESSENTSAESDTENSVSGVVVKISDDTIGIDAKGISYEFTITNAEKPEEQIKIDDNVEITFKGSLHDEKLEATKIVESTATTEEETNTTTE